MTEKLHVLALYFSMIFNGMLSLSVISYILSGGFSFIMLFILFGTLLSTFMFATYIFFIVAFRKR